MRFVPGFVIAIAIVAASATSATSQDSVWQSYFDAGQKAFSEKKWENAVKFFKLAVKEGDRQKLKNQSMAAALHNTAAALSNLNKYEDAIAYAERASTLYGEVLKGYEDDSIRCSNLLGLCYLQTGKHKKAIPFLDWAIYAMDESGKLPDQLASSIYNLGLCHFETGDLKKAEEMFRRSRKEYARKESLDGEARALRQLARVAVKQKDNDTAMERYLEAAEKFARFAKEDKSGFESMSDCYDEIIKILETQKKPDEVASLQKKLEETLTKAGAGGRKALARRYYDRAWKEKNANRYKDAEAQIRKAIDMFDRIADESETSIFAHAVLAQVLARRGEAVEAVKEFKRAISLAEEFEPEDKINRRWVYTQYADYLSERSKPAEALPFYLKALGAAEKRDGDDAESVAFALSELVSVYGELKRWDDALAAAERQLSIREKAKGKEAPEVVGPLQQLAWVFEKRKEFGKAERLLKRALAIREEHGGPGKSETFSSVQRLARLYQADSRPEDAEKLFRRTISDWETALGADSPDMAYALKGLASFLMETGKYEEAEKLFRRALVNREKALGPDHRLVADSLGDLAGFFHELGRQAEAEPLYKRALKIYETTDGPRSVAVADTLHGLGWVYIRQVRYEDGIPLAKKSLEIHEETGARLRTLARACNTLAVLVDDRNQHDEAEALYRKAIKFYEQDDGPEQLGLAAALHNLGMLCSSTDRNEEAESLYRRSTAIEEKAGVEDDEVTVKLNRAGNLARGYGNLAGLLSSLGQKEEAESYAKKALEVREKYLGKEHPDVVGNLIQLAGFAAGRGEYAQREALYNRAAELRKKLHSADGDISLASNHTEAAVLHRYHGRLGEAETAYRTAEALYDKRYSGNPAHLVGIWQSQGDLLTGLGRYDDAKKLLQKVLDYREKTSPGSTSYASALLEIADFEYAVGDFESARKREAAAYKIYTKVYGDGTPATRWLVARQAASDLRTGRYAEARKKYEKLLAEWEKDSPRTPDYLDALADVAWMDVLENKPSALEKLEEALALAEKFHGPDPYYRAGLLSNRAEALFRSGKAKDAETPARQVFEAYTKRLGAAHPATAAAGLHLGRILVALGKGPEAAKLIAAAREYRDKIYSASNPKTADTRRAEAELAAAEGREEEAAKLFAEAVKIRDANYVSDHPETLRLLVDYVKVLEKTRAEDAKAIQERIDKAKSGGGR